MRLSVGSLDGAAVNNQQLPAFLDNDVKRAPQPHDKVSR
jgi:hypothetical protein